MTSETLRPCPFCGGAARRARTLRDGCRDGEPDAWAYYVVCVSCAAQGGWAKNEAGADRLWRSRATPQDGPVVQLLLNDLGNRLYMLDASDSVGRWQALPSPIAAMLIPALGLAPGEVTRVRLVPLPEGET